ncbi:MAG: hypothetical protein QOI95_563 [Acidimicrobiaceae bacterium]|jgi:hypothetical protein
MNTWHAEDDLLMRYERGAIDPANAASVEAHLTACEQCRAAFSAVASDQSQLDASWAMVVDELDRPRIGFVERLLRAVRVPEHWARVVAATPALRLSWILSVVALVALGLSAAHTGTDDPSVFLLLAPILPLAGIATAFGPGIDPCYEVGVAAPISGFRLLLLRSVAVLATSVPVVGGAAFALPSIGWTAAAWLLPTAALVGCSLALSTRVAPARACAMLTAAWALVVGSSAYLGHGRTIAARSAAFSATGQVIALGVAILALVIAVHRAPDVDANLYGM